MSAGLSASGLGFRYGAKEALKDVSFDIPKARFCALLGPNGAGKSTLFSLLTRLLVSRQGRIEMAGHDLGADPGKALAKLGVVFQQPTLDLDLSVRQNLRYFAALHGLSGAAVEIRITECLARLDMAERADERVRSLNGGHRRRTEIARSLLHDPEVLLLDEPTVGLDAATRATITEHVHALANQGLTVLWATHLTDEIRDTDHLLILHRGQIVADGAAADIRGERSLEDHFLNVTGANA